MGQFGHSRQVHGIGEMAQWRKCLLPKPECLHLDPQYPLEKPGSMPVKSQSWEVETGGSLGLAGYPVQSIYKCYV